MIEMQSPQDALRAVVSHIPPDIRRITADAMSDFRAEIGEDMAALLEDRSPEERTWLQGLVSAAISSTDYWDGLLTKDLPPSEDGMVKDRLGDVKYVKPQQKRLARNGEVSPVHYRLKVGRELAMRGVRWWGARNGKNLKSLQSGRAKTWAEMSELAAAHSPLAENEELMEWGASIGTGLSINSLAGTIFQYMGDDGSENVTDPRNSTAREKSSGLFGKMADFVDEKAPWFTPSHATKLGKTMVEGSAALLIAKPDRAGLATAMYTAFSLFDGFDGSLARKKGVAGTEGMIEDVQADLEQQIATLGALSIVAMRRGNRAAAANYALATMLMPLSAYTRAQAESQGFVVAEGGMGTRIGRSILAGIGMAGNKRRDMSDVVSGTLATGIADTVLERRDVLVKGEDSNYYVGINRDPELMEEGAIRARAIQPYAEAGLIAGSMLLAANQSDTIQRLIPKAKPAV